jgi:MFS family permease
VAIRAILATAQGNEPTTAYRTRDRSTAVTTRWKLRNRVIAHRSTLGTCRADVSSALESLGWRDGCKLPALSAGIVARRMLSGRLDLRQRFARSELPASFWYLWLGTIVNRLGGFAAPFLVLYLTARLGMNVADAAFLVSVLGAGSFIAQLTGGELADRLGRRPVMMLSFFAAPVAMIVLGLTHAVPVLFAAMFALGFLTDLSRPAINAAVVDLVPADRRSRAFGYIYWAINLGAALAPIIAGLLANFDYFLLFVGDALTTAVFGVIVLTRVPETQALELALEARVPTRSRVGQALRDPMLLFFVVLSLLGGIIYSQSNVTLPLDMAANGLPPSDYGLAVAVNGGLIVLVTLSISRRAERLPRYLVMAAAAVLLGIGFGLTALASTLLFYAFTVCVWTFGEVISASIAPTIVSEISPPALRGLYQGLWGSAWGLAFFLGPALGGFVFDHLGSDTLWAMTFVIGLIVAFGYLAMSVPARRRARLGVADSP